MNHRTLARYALGSAALVELGAGLIRGRDRRFLFAKAQERAAATNRPLVVVGDPDAGAWTRFLWREYGCGSICVDLTGCPSCPVAIPADITRPVQFGPNAGEVAAVFRMSGTPDQIVPANSAVVFVSCVLEYVPDPAAAWAEILRMAGSPENVFMAEVQPWTATAVLYPGAKFTIERQGNGPEIHYQAVTPARKLLYGGVLAGLVVASLI